MNNYLNKIAVVGSSNCFNAITNILKGMKIEYEVIGETTKNIVVSFNKSSKRTVVGAHYDAYYSGANDNGAVCVILLNLIDELRNTTNSYGFVIKMLLEGDISVNEDGTINDPDGLLK